jgi:1-acyl-sn-glycerol-3-phosphate acyltransferase
MAWRSLRAASGAIVARRTDLQVEGLEHLPERGPAIIAARHFHHLFDGAAILAAVPRPVHILVALDWVSNPVGKIAMRQACRAANWPVVYRSGGPVQHASTDAAIALRRAIRDSLALLDAGRILLVFPEGYPNIDPGYTPKQSESEFLRFQPGFARLAALAAARELRAPIVPAGLEYRRSDRWQIQLRFGDAIEVCSWQEAAAIVDRVERQVVHLSGDSPERVRPQRPSHVPGTERKAR